jgi:hypothetical protein
VTPRIRSPSTLFYLIPYTISTVLVRRSWAADVFLTVSMGVFLRHLQVLAFRGLQYLAALAMAPPRVGRVQSGRGTPGVFPGKMQDAARGGSAAGRGRSSLMPVLRLH